MTAMSAPAHTTRPAEYPARQALVRRAWFHGESLHMSNQLYRAAVAALLDPLLLADRGSGDLTFQALRLDSQPASAEVLAKEPGIAAGVEEFAWLLSRAGAAVNVLKPDGEEIAPGEALARVGGPRDVLLCCERTALNLLQRMSGIATLTRRLTVMVQRQNPGTCLLATRKTPWGLLDKRAVALGGGGTHRLGLHDAILIKNNHLSLLSASEEQAVQIALERAHARRGDAAFIEVEVRTEAAALAAATAFARLNAAAPAACPSLLLLDNMPPRQAQSTIAALQSRNLRDHVLIEISGTLNESNLEQYASCGADALSLGALTHSPRALDVSMTFC